MNQEKIKNFFNGKCSPKEAAEVLRWLKSKEAELDLSDELYQQWQKMEYEESGNSDLLPRIHHLIEARSAHARHKSFRFFNYTALKIAASFGLFVLTIWGIYQLGYFRNENLVAEAPSTEVITKRTQPGQKLTVTLPDRSVVMLNSGSAITYPSLFGDSVRQVHLQGEAFFEVEKSEIPFIVTTGSVNTRVLGTSFNIRYQENEPAIVVALLTGSVEISEDEGESLSLVPGDLLKFDQVNKSFSKTQWDYKKEFGWKEGILWFEHATLEEIAERLEPWYGIEIQIQELNTNKRHFTGSFQNSTLKNVMESLGFTFGFDYVINQETVTIKPK